MLQPAKILTREAKHLRVDHGGKVCRTRDVPRWPPSTVGVVESSGAPDSPPWPTCAHPRSQSFNSTRWFAGCYGAAQGAAASPPSRRLGGSGVRFGFLLCLLGQPVSRVVC